VFITLYIFILYFNTVFPLQRLTGQQPTV